MKMNKKIDDLRSQDKESLMKTLNKLHRDKFNLRMQKAVGEFKKVHLFKQNRRDIAQINTVLNAKDLGI
jgi:large subunit ribosomal protein L29